MICPVRAFSPNTTHLFYWKLAAEVQCEATSLQITLSDRMYMSKQLVKISHLYFDSFSGIIFVNLPKNIQQLYFKKMTKNSNIR